MFAPVTAFKNHPAVGGVPGRELTNFPNAGGARITVPQKCGASFSQFVKCQNSTGSTQVLCFLILFAEDVAPDRVRRRSHGLDLEVKGFVNGVKSAFKCILSLAARGWPPSKQFDAIALFLRNSK
jgi:hypothetical protein